MSNNSYLGTQTPYMFYPGVYTRPPSGYKPVYINHLGRHGARYLTSDEDLLLITEVLEDARLKAALTPMGLALKMQIDQLQSIETGEYGQLTASGKNMERGIAKRMYQRYPEVFGKKVVATSTYVARTKESMDAFLEELGRYTTPTQFVEMSNEKIDPILRFFDLNEAYLAYKKAGKWKESVKQFAKRQDVSKTVLKPFFSPAYMGNIENKEAVATALYKLYTNQYDIEQNLGLGRYFDRWMLKYYWENENLSTYLEKGPSYEGENLPTDIAYPLLADFLITADEALDQGDRSADLRFAHAETIIPFASLLGLKGASTQTDAVGCVASIWKDYEVAPMAANIQWIFYRKKGSDTVLVKVLYNEREVRLPIESSIAPYYKWEDVKQFYIQKLQALDVDWKEPLVGQVKNFVPRVVHRKYM